MFSEEYSTVEYTTADLWFNGLLFWQEVVDLIVNSVDAYFVFYQKG